MKVYYDAQIFFLQKYGGISNYFSNLIKNFLENPSLDIQPILQVENLSNVHFQNTLNHLGKITPKKDFFLINLLNNAVKIPTNILDIDLIHFTYYLPSRLLSNKKIKKVSTIHDFIPETVFSLFSPNRYTHFFKNSYIKKSDGIIFVSKYTQQLANARYINLQTKRSSVIYHGIDKTQINVDTSPFSGKNFFLYVGKRYSYKNFSLLLKAFHRVVQSVDVYLVCFGGSGQTKEELKLIRDYALEDRIFFTNDKFSNIDMLYQSALGFINPSLEEGFGITNLEALANNCVVLCSDIPVFREILGDRALYFDPRSENSLIEKMNHTISQVKNKENLASLRDIELEYSWYETARETAMFYKSLFN